MKIGLAHNLYGKYSHGGAETVVELMALDYIKSGHEVFLITTKPREKDGKAPVETNEFGLKIYYVNSKFYNLTDLNNISKILWHAANMFSIKKYSAIKKILQTEKPDLFVTHNLMGLGFLTPIAIKSLNIRHEHFLHDIQLLHPSGLMIYGKENILNSFGAKIYQSLTVSLFCSPSKVISPSKWLLDIHLQNNFFKKSETEIRPFKFKEFIPNKKNISGNGTAEKKQFRNFLFIGQIEESKGIMLLISAFKKINDSRLRLTIASRNGGHKLDEALKLIEGDKRISLLSPLSFAETEAQLKKNDCLIVPSLCYENSPTVIYGAHAAGIPVIASRIGGIPEIVDKNDLLFEPGNEEDLIAKIMINN